MYLYFVDALFAAHDDVSDRDLYDGVAVLETSSDISSKLVVLCRGYNSCYFFYHIVIHFTF